MPATKSRRKKNPAHTAYERALVLLYKGNYAKAQAALETLAQKYPDEKQLMAQVSMFLRLCQQNNQRPKKVAQDGIALYDLGVFEHNRGHFDKALDLFKRALKKVSNKTDEAAVYAAMAAGFARTGPTDKALECLHKAIQADEIHRHHARHDPDFDSLDSNEEFRKLVATDQGSS